MTVRALPFVLGFSISVTAWAQDPPAARRAAAAITAADLRRHVLTLADDSMRGRWTPSPELEVAAQYIAAQLRQAGLRQGGDQGSYLQRFAIDAFQILPESASVSVTGTTPTRWTNGLDYAFPFNSWSNWNAAGNAVLLRGPLGARAVFDTASLRGRVLLLTGGWGPHYGRLEKWGPAGIVWLEDVADSVLAGIVRGQARPARRAPGGDSLPLVLMSYRAVGPLLVRAGVDTAGLARPSADSVLRAIALGDAVIHVTGRVRRLPHQEPANVVAILEGTDPALRSEYVVYSAHYDHLGVRAPINGDSIWNGADDNASGTAAVLAVAEAFARLPARPRRSMMFVLVSAEEFLGLGSRFFVDHPPVPASAIVANLNADMVGRNWTDTVVVLGRRDSDLGSIVDRILSSHSELGLAATDSSTRPNEPRDLYTWSDHVAFIQKGIPFLYFYSGMHADYHRRSDSGEKIDFEKLARISRLMFYVGLDIANADRRPQWDAESYRRLVPRP